MRLSVQIEIDKAMDLETPKKKVTVGRSSENEIVINHNSISRNHCVIEETENGFIITDLGSSNGTFINDIRLSPNKKTLLKGKYFTMGRVECELRTSSPDNTAPLNIVSSEMSKGGDFTSTIRISRLELNRPSITLENEKKIKVQGPRNPISQRLDRQPVKPIKQSRKWFIYILIPTLLALAWYLGEK